MAPATINDLSVEIHFLILSFLTSLSAENQISKDGGPRSPSLFPFNIASVWRDIISLMPECWDRVVFDVARDPKPILDVFLWTKHLEKFDVLVFNSNSGHLNGTQDTGSGSDIMLERKRISAVTQALVPHIHRCKSVEFDVVYASSLPCPSVFFRQDLPDLEELTLNCRLDDIFIGNEPSEMTINNKPPHPLSISFPKLKTLSLTGFWFMQLGLAPASSSWFKQLHSAKDMSLFISRFMFLDHGEYTMQKFLSCLCGLSTCTSFFFRDLSHSSSSLDRAQTITNRTRYKLCGTIHFLSVSEDFLSHLYTTAEVSGPALSFDKCRIPEIPQVQLQCDLELRNLSGGDQSCRSSSSLRHILAVWSGRNLTINSCPSFTDDLLFWLRSEAVYTRPCTANELTSSSPVFHYHKRLLSSEEPFKTFPADGIQTLNVNDCCDFTPSAIQQFIKVRYDAAIARGVRTSLAPGPEETSAVICLWVSGRVPTLSQEDKNWFYDNKNITMTIWKMMNEEGKTMVMFTAWTRGVTNSDNVDPSLSYSQY